jgi:hypothetical protein
MKKVETFGQLVKGKIHYTKLEAFKTAVFATFKEGERFKVSYEKIYKKRSSNQNRYYWGIIINCYCEAYKLTQGRELGIEVLNRETGEVIYIPLNEKERAEQAHKELKTLFDLKTTTENTTTQQEEYHMFCREYVKAVFNYDIPLPGEQSQIDL